MRGPRPTTFPNAAIELADRAAVDHKAEATELGLAVAAQERAVNAAVAGNHDQLTERTAERTDAARSTLEDTIDALSHAVAAFNIARAVEQWAATGRYKAAGYLALPNGSGQGMTVDALIADLRRAAEPPQREQAAAVTA